MATELETLTTLQRLDQAISEKQQEADSITRRLDDLELAVKVRAAEAGGLRTEHDAKRKRQRELELELQEIEEKTKDRRMRIQRIRSDKELQATQREIESMKERTGQLEEELLQILEEVEALEAKVITADENLKGGQVALDAEQSELRVKQAGCSEEVGRDRTARDELASAIDSTLRRRYETLFKRRGGSAVVAVRAGVCDGCNMNVPPQLYNEILRAEVIHACPSCHRILFCPPPEPDPG